MKETNSMEQQLRSLQPRRPSAGLKQRILSAGPGRHSTAWFWGGLMPATACVLLSLLIFKPENEFSTRPPAGLLASNIDFPVYADSRNNQENHLAGVTFDWTNRSDFKSSISFTPSTNSN